MAAGYEGNDSYTKTIHIQQFFALPPEKQRELLKNAEEESQWLIHMVENLLTITRLGGEGETRLTTQPEAVEEVMVKS